MKREAPSSCPPPLKRMNEVALLLADAAPAAAPPPPCDLTPCDLTPCDAGPRPSPSPPSPSACKQSKDEECDRDGRKPEQQKHCGQVQPKKRAKAKGRLVRSMAVCEESPPFEESQVSADPSSCHHNESTSCKEEEQEGSDPKKPSLSKEPSVEYTDSTGIDLQQFIVDTLNSNPRDRMMLLKLEQDMIDFITSDSPFKKFPQMSSYHRMLVHRVAAYFGMEHNVDHTGRSVIINRTSGTRIPEQRFQEQVHKDKTEEIQHWKMILKRDNSSEEQARLHPLQEKQGKSMEEREEEYRRARERIFNREPLCSQDVAHAETRPAEEYNPYAETQRRRQLFRGSRDSSGSSWTGSSRQSSTEMDCRYGSNDPRPWSSIDSDSSFQLASPAPKARQSANHSWDAAHSTTAAASISLYRLPPTCAHPSPPPPAPPPPQQQAPIVVEELPATSSYIMENGIPPGSILVNPHTGKPFLNPDGTPAVYNPPDSQQPTRSQPQLQGSASQHHQQQQQVLQYTVSYTAPQMLPVAPSQPYSTMEELSSQFAHVSCQSTGEAPPLYAPTQSYVYTAPPPQLAPPNPSSYCQPSPQMPIYYYSQYPTSVQNPCKPVSPSQHIQHSQAVQPAAGYTTGVGVQQQSSHSQTQQQAVLGTYSPVASHQCSMVQGGVQMSYPQSKVAVGAEAAYCCVLPPPLPSHHSGCHQPSCTNLGAAATAAWGAQY